MKALIQRVKKSSVTVEGEIIGSINQGILVFLGVAGEDEEKNADYLAEKIVHLRIFEDSYGKMNRSLIDIEGDLLVISQFTLLGDARKGRRPSFINAAKPDKANRLYEYFIKKVKSMGIDTETGKFQAHMDVSIVNDGPVTMLLEST